MAFLIAHIVSLVVDPKAGVSVAGAFIPGLSEYRSSPVAIGTLALYAFLVTAVTRALDEAPAARRRGCRSTGWRWSIWVMAWMHGVLAGTDTGALGPMYVGAGLLVVGAGAYRYWASRKKKPTFSTSRQEVARRMNITSLRSAALLTTVGVVAALVLGFGSIQAAAAWTAAAAPLGGRPSRRRVDPGPPRPGAGTLGRDADAARALAATVAEMTAALEAAQARIAADAGACQGARRGAQGGEAEARQASRRPSRRRRRPRPDRSRRRPAASTRPPRRRATATTTARIDDD